MNQKTQLRLVLMQTIYELNGSAKKEDILSHMQDNQYWRYNDDNDGTPPSRPSESSWRNNFSYERDSLKRDGYLDGSQRGVWTLTPEAGNYFDILKENAIQKTYSEEYLFTEKFYNIVKNDFLFSEIVVDDQLIRKINNEDFHFEQSGQLDNSPKPKGDIIQQGKRKVYKRSLAVSQKALAIANHRCEVDNEHPSFERRNTPVLYMEPHHLIPMCETDNYDVSLDREQNIVCLCSTCHNLLHYGEKDAVKQALLILYNKKQPGLNQVIGREVTLRDLLRIYGVK